MRKLRYGSVCSGIEAVTVAWHDLEVDGLGLEPAWFAEVDSFCCALLKEKYPHVPNLNDISREDFCDRAEQLGPIDILVGGPPCQSFSSAGKRGGLADARGNLLLRYCAIAARLRPEWFVLENVPGLLSSDGGRAFGAFLGQMAGCGYAVSWRICDAQHWGVPQRRRRVFAVGHLRDKSAPAAVLFEPQGEGRDSQARRSPRKKVAGPAGTGIAERVNPPACFAENQRHEVRMMDVASALSTGGGKPGQGYPAVLQEESAVFRKAMKSHNKEEAERWERDEVSGALNRFDVGRDLPAHIVVQENVPFNVNSAQSCAKEDHAFETETSRCLDTNGGFASGQGGTVVVERSEAYQCHGTNVGPMGTLRAGNGNETGGVPFVAEALAFTERGRKDGAETECQDDLAYCLRNSGDGGRSTDRQVAYRVVETLAFTSRGRAECAATECQEDMAYCLRNAGEGGGGAAAAKVAYRLQAFGQYEDDDTASALKARDYKDATDLVVNQVRTDTPANVRYIVRRLTPREAERLMGFPEDYSLIVYKGRIKKEFLQEMVLYLTETTGRTWTAEEVKTLAADSHRYKSLGNSLVVPLARWIGERLLRVQAMMERGEAVPSEML